MISFVEGVCCELICTKKHLLSPKVNFNDSKACWALKIPKLKLIKIERSQKKISNHLPSNIALSWIMQQNITV